MQTSATTELQKSWNHGEKVSFRASAKSNRDFCYLSTLKKVSTKSATDFHELNFVEAPDPPSPGKRGVKRLDSVGLKVSCSDATFWVFQTCVDRIWSPNRTRLMFGGILFVPLILVKLTILYGHCRRSLLCQALVAWPRLRQWEEGDGCDGAKMC